MWAMIKVRYEYYNRNTRGGTSTVLPEPRVIVSVGEVGGYRNAGGNNVHLERKHNFGIIVRWSLSLCS